MNEDNLLDDTGSSISDNIYDETEKDTVVPPVSYDVTSYGSDPDVDGLVRKLKRNDIIIPPFQRDYVWRQPEASRFIESLLLGLPVPGIFLATDPLTNKQLVIDGQQRLKSLLFFYDGYFNPRPDDKHRRLFKLAKVQAQFEGKTYNDLDERDKARLDNSVIHATIVKQTAPPGNDTSLYHIFERLNSGGRLLTAQEIRVALYHGRLMDKIHFLSESEPWKKIFGKPDSRLKGQELILRFFALFINEQHYRRPMSDFLSKFAGNNQSPDDQFLKDFEYYFVLCCDLFFQALGKKVFRPTRALNAAVFDSCMVGLARRIKAGGTIEPSQVREAYEGLFKDLEYVEATSRSTADEMFVKRRLDRSREAFSRT